MMAEAASVEPIHRQPTGAAATARGGVRTMGFVMTFEECVFKLSGGMPPVPCEMMPSSWEANVTLALMALAAERAAEPRVHRYPAPGVPGGTLNIIHAPHPAEPRSISHWGLHA